MKPSVQGFTKMPNWLFPRLPELSPAGMRVTMVILAESVGWGVEAVILSKADFMRLSGLARSSVEEGIKAALQAQVIERRPYQQSFAYRLKAPTDTTPFPWASLRQSLTPPTRHNEVSPLTEHNDDAPPSAVPSQTRTESSPDVSEFQAATNSGYGPDPPDFQSVKAGIQADASSIPASAEARNSAHLSAISDGKNGALRTSQERKQENTQALCEHTHNGSCSPSARARPRCASRYCYDEVLAYAQSLKGIRNPGGLAVVYWRSGDMDEEIARFQTRQAELAAQQAAEAAAHEIELRALAVELRTRGEPLAEWEREIIAVFADEVS